MQRLGMVSLINEVNMNQSIAIGEVSNGADESIAASEPYSVAVRLTGSADLLFHRWNNEAVAAKAGAAKNSKTKKTDNVESYVYRNEAGMICLPGEYLRGAIVTAAKFRQDPRSSRKSAMDLYRAGVISMTPLASLGRDTWDYEDSRRVVVQRAGITRVRPAMRHGWNAEFVLTVLTPEYIAPTDLHAVMAQAGTLIGLGDFRPTYGRFNVTSFEVIKT
jgi:hypothetical protein